jgi:hypothetical protein
MECVTLTFAYKASQYQIDVWPQQITTQFTDDVRPKIVEVALKYILPSVYTQYVIISFGIVYH